MELSTSLLIAPIRVYRHTLALLLPPACRFEPSCSRYAAGAIQTFGPIRGLVMATSRILRCHPWNAGGDDPVPAKRTADEERNHGSKDASRPVSRDARPPRLPVRLHAEAGSVAHLGESPAATGRGDRSATRVA